MPVKILAFSGSTRTPSLNKRVLRIAIELIKSHGGEVTYIELRDYPLPLYDGDLEEKEGIPENAKKLKALFMEHQGLLLASPENNSSLSAVLKNAIDWVSRPLPEESEYLICFKNKLALLLSASTGIHGGVRGLAALRSILQNIGTMVYPKQMILPKAEDKFNSDGSFKESRNFESLTKLTKSYLETLTKLY